MNTQAAIEIGYFGDKDIPLIQYAVEDAWRTSSRSAISAIIFCLTEAKFIADRFDQKIVALIQEQIDEVKFLSWVLFDVYDIDS